MSAGEIEDRRQRAREAFSLAVVSSSTPISECADAAIEAATQVKITAEVIEEFREHALIPRAVVENALRHTLAALGFEVVE